MNAPTLLRGFNFLYFALLAMFIPFLPVYLGSRVLTRRKLDSLLVLEGLLPLLLNPYGG